MGKRERKKELDFSEATNPSSIPLFDAFRQGRTSKQYAVAAAIVASSLAQFAPGVMIALMTYLPNYLKQREFRQFVDKHREDGLLLLWVSPPRDRKWRLSLSFHAWERRMLGLGYLSPAGGLTPAGIDYLRRMLPPKEVQRRILETKTARQSTVKLTDWL